MNLKKEDLLLYAVTDRAWTGNLNLAGQVELALRGGATMVQFREKCLVGEELCREAMEVQKVCRSFGVPFIIDDDVELAKRIDADGVHVGQKDMDAAFARRYLGGKKIIGVSARTVVQAVKAKNDGADYLGVGAMFATKTKGDAVVIERETVRHIKREAELPIVGIGGICLENVGELAGLGIDGIAVIGGIFGQEDIEGAARGLRGRMEEYFIETDTGELREALSEK